MLEESNLLKEAIADAKAIRATAVANAKLALQEHFSEIVHGALSEKLREELEDDAFTDEGGSEIESSVVPTDVPPVDATIPPVAAPVSAPVVPPVAPSAPVAPVVPPVDPVVPPVDGVPTQPTEETPLQETEDPQGEKVKYTVIGNTPKLKETSPTDPKKPLTGEKTKDELKSSGQFKDQFQDGTPTIKEEKTQDDLKSSGQFKDQYKDGTPSINEETSEEKDELDAIKEELEKGAEKEDDDDEVVEEIAQVAPATAPVSEEAEETINFDELMAEIEGSVASTEDVPAQSQPVMEALRSEVASLKKSNSQLNEVVSYLRGKLNEINLLNAKLLYTNKLFNAGNLSSDQKMKIVEAMDLTKNTREVKLVYSTIAESISFGAKSKTVISSPSKKVAVATITEGLASKQVSSTKPSKEVLTEGTEMASRFQKLAGIKKQVL